MIERTKGNRGFTFERAVPWFLAAGILALVLGCGSGAREAPPSGDESAEPGERPGILSDLDALQARAESLERGQRFALHAAAACLDACLAGVERVEVRRGLLSCKCRRPSVGVHRVARGAP